MDDRKGVLVIRMLELGVVLSVAVREAMLDEALGSLPRLDES